MNILNTLKLLNPDLFPPIMDIQACMHSPSTSSIHIHYTRVWIPPDRSHWGHLGGWLPVFYKVWYKNIAVFQHLQVEMEVRGMWGESSFFPENHLQLLAYSFTVLTLDIDFCLFYFFSLPILVSKILSLFFLFLF